MLSSNFFLPSPRTKWIFSKLQREILRWLILQCFFFLLQQTQSSVLPNSTNSPGQCTVISNFNWMIRTGNLSTISRFEIATAISAFSYVPLVVLWPSLSTRFVISPCNVTGFPVVATSTTPYCFSSLALFLAGFLLCPIAGHRDVTLNFVRVCSLSSAWKGTATRGDFATRLDNFLINLYPFVHPIESHPGLFFFRCFPSVFDTEGTK